MEKLSALIFNLKFEVNKLEKIKDRISSDPILIRDENFQMMFNQKLGYSMNLFAMLEKFIEEAELLTVRDKIKLNRNETAEFKTTPISSKIINAKNYSL